MHRLIPYEPVAIEGAGGAVTALPIEFNHGTIRSLGFRIGGLAYVPDLNGVPDKAAEALRGLDTWIVDALRPTPHPSHFSLPETLRWIEALKPKSAILTNMHIDMDYDTLCRELPDHVRPAHDGMQVSVSLKS